MHSFGRGEILCLAVSDIGFGRSPIRPVRSSLDSCAGYAGRVRGKPSCSVFLQEFLDDTLDIAIVTLSEVVIPNSLFRVDEILGWPSLVIERLPDSIVAVDGDWKSNVQIAYCILHVHRFVL